MSYRKIEVNGKRYGYVVGRSHVKIRGDYVSILKPKSEVGQPVGQDKYVITPANIRNVILGGRGPKVLRCDEHDVETTELEYDPYGLEIYGKKDLVIACQRCLDRSGWEI
jgi:hypothetical protein